jgi:putative addiction module component (TIGR02574 family)
MHLNREGLVRFARYIFFMNEEIAELLRRARALSSPERAELAFCLLENLAEAEDGSVQVAWDAEIARRLEDLNSGKVKPVSLEDARRRLSSAIG